MEPTTRSQRRQSAAKQSKKGLNTIGLLFMLASVLMCYLIILSVSQSLRLSEMHVQLINMAMPTEMTAEEPARQTNKSATKVSQTPSSVQEETNPETSPAVPTGVYVVAEGDTLSMIAEKFNTSVEALMNQNGLSSNLLQIGQEIGY